MVLWGDMAARPIRCVATAGFRTPLLARKERSSETRILQVRPLGSGGA